ncbi:hypothetical protein [Methyloceanibacter stevinii]|uniref:hypothetical protein n=1 Tax=Methyloceanibacter stevinii TaxID=1774970 RepID=UPI000A8C6E7F|nr:hypothetical protein [Methyloceanibacter stevinii]
MDMSSGTTRKPPSPVAPDGGCGASGLAFAAGAACGVGAASAGAPSVSVADTSVGAAPVSEVSAAGSASVAAAGSGVSTFSAGRQVTRARIRSDRRSSMSIRTARLPAT